MKAFLSALVLLQLSVMSISANPLKELKWKKRVVVLNFASGDSAKLSELEAEIMKTKSAWRERDITIFHVGDLGKTDKSYAVRLTEAERVAVRKQLGLSSSSTSRALLIGKDGGVKSTQRGTFSLRKFYALIDTMPMRRKEMMK